MVRDNHTLEENQNPPRKETNHRKLCFPAMCTRYENRIEKILSKYQFKTMYRLFKMVSEIIRLVKD